MNYQYPLESLARKRGSSSQQDFARQARGALMDGDEAIFEPHDHGLVILAANEDALVEPRRILRDIYGDFVEIRAPKVRHLPGEPPHEPVAHARISTRGEFSLRVVAELRRRGARILEQCSRPRVFIVRAEAPLAALLGLPAKLEAIAGDDVTHAIRLVRYEPLDAGPGAA